MSRKNKIRLLLYLQMRIYLFLCLIRLTTLGNINVTMGYIENATTNSLFKSLFKLHYSKEKFYYKDVISIIQNELLDSFDENVNILELVKKNNLIYISAKDLTN